MLTSRFVSRLLFVIAFVSAFFVSGCAGWTAADAQTASAVISGVVSAAPVACAIVSASGGNGTACSKDTGAASAVADMVEKILASIPTTGRKMGESAPLVQLTVRKNGSDVTLTLPKPDADYLVTHYPASGS